MPQMAPLNWLTLFIFFSLIFLCFNMSNYFLFQYPVKFTQKKTSTLKYNWKW